MTATSTCRWETGEPLHHPMEGDGWSPARARAKSSCASDGSTPWTSAGAKRLTISSVKAPFPQPTSIHLSPDSGFIQSRKHRREFAPYPHHPLVAGSIIETNLLLCHWQGTPLKYSIQILLRFRFRMAQKRQRRYRFERLALACSMPVLAHGTRRAMSGLCPECAAKRTSANRGWRARSRSTIVQL